MISGSTTIKCVVLDEHEVLVYSTYERHYSHILEKAQELLRRVDEQYLHGEKALLSISGSAGMGLADSCGVPFVQEVFSTRVAVKRFQPGTDCVIELGGEDAKILFLTGGTEVRMNGSCAGGTGAFIDQMATLLKMSAQEMNTAAEQAQRTYTIASRCGVFAKSDVQPLINQGARTEDIAASIYKAVVNQTIAGLAQGRPSGAMCSIWAVRSPSARCCARALMRRWVSPGCAQKTACCMFPWALPFMQTRSSAWPT